MMKVREAEFQFEVEPPEEANCQGAGQTVSRWLRGVGALIIVVSATSFLFKHWTPGNDWQRYLCLLGFTAILSVAGLFCGLTLKEGKGARTLLGLTLAVTPVNFAVMGAFLYSQFSWDGSFSRLPNYATWVADSPLMAVVATVCGGALLVSLGHFSFMTLGRKYARLFSITFLIGNGALLLPTRQPGVIAAVFLLLLVWLVSAEMRWFGRGMILRTADGALARGLLWVPALIVVGRSCYFYAPSQLFGSVVLAGGGILSFLLLPQFTMREKWQKVCQGCGAALAGLAWVNAAEVGLHGSLIGYRYEILVMLLPLAGVLWFLGKYAIGSGDGYRRLATLIAVAAGVINLVAYPGFTMAVLCLLLAVGGVVAGYVLEQKVEFAGGVLGCLVAIAYQFKMLFSHFSLGGWSSLMVVGVLIIVSASVMERHGGVLKETLLRGHKEFKRWGH